MSTRLVGGRTGFRAWLGGWLLLVLFLHSACATGLPLGGTVLGATYRYQPMTPPFYKAPRERIPLTPEPGLEEAPVYAVDFLEPGSVATRPVPIAPAQFREAVRRLSSSIQVKGSPREAARELMALSQHSPQAQEDVETVSVVGWYLLEGYREQTHTFIPEYQVGPVTLTPEADETLKRKYLEWCTPRGGGDCLGLLDDEDYLRTDDRRTLALALAFGSVLDETRQALARELLDVRAIVSMVVWAVAFYCMLWLVPEPVTKALAASLTLLLAGYVGLGTVWRLMDGWAHLATVAHRASTFEELRAAGAEFGKVLGEDAARAMILAVSALAGRTMGEVAARVKSLPGYGQAGAQWRAQGGEAVLAPELAAETALAGEGALARAVASVETVAASPQGPLAAVMLKKGPAGGAAPGGRSPAIVLRHRGGNWQVEFSNGQRWHVPRGKSVADIPTEDKVGDMLQEAVTRAAKEWGPHRLSSKENKAINDARERGEYWLARLLEREARGRYVHAKVEEQFRGRFRFNHQGVDVIDQATGLKYEILSGTESNLAWHGRRMASEFFRMLTF